MTILTVDMPEELRSWIDRQIEGGRYVDAGDYLRHLVRRDSGFHAREVARVQTLLDAGWESGIVDREPEDVLADIMAKIPAGDG